MIDSKKPAGIKHLFIVFAVLLSCTFLLLSAYSNSNASDSFIVNSDGSNKASDNTKKVDKCIRELVEEFGSRLKNVSLLAPRDIVIASIKENYSDYVTPELLEKWKADPRSAPGRITSSPWPERIEISKIVKADEKQYVVYGNVIEITSVELSNGGVAARQPVVIHVKNINGCWLIDDWRNKNAF